MGCPANMTKKRSRGLEKPCGDDSLTERAVKRVKGVDKTSNQRSPVSHPLLSRLFPHLQTLRDYVLSRLPASSRLRRKKIASVGLQSESKVSVTDIELAVARLLDATVVACSPQPEAPHDDRWGKWNSFSQKGDESYVTLSDGYEGASFCQTEVGRNPNRH